LEKREYARKQLKSTICRTLRKRGLAIVQPFNALFHIGARNRLQVQSISSDALRSLIMEALLNNAAKIIQESSATTLSLYVFCILVTAVLVVILFRAAPLAVRIGAFVVTLILMVVIFILTWPRPKLAQAQHWLSIFGIEGLGGSSSAENLRAIVRIGDVSYSYPSTSFFFTLGSHPIPATYPLPVGVEKVVLHFQALRLRDGNTIDRFNTDPTREIDLSTQAPYEGQAKKFRIDQHEQMSPSPEFAISYGLY
jgi:hypothetical protein